MALDLFPIMVPDGNGGRNMRMLYVFSYGGESQVSCARELTKDEHDWLCANWPEYLRQRAEWLTWARAKLQPAFQPGNWPGRKMTPADVQRMLDFQT